MNNYYKSGRYERDLTKAWEYNKKKREQNNAEKKKNTTENRD